MTAFKGFPAGKPNTVPVHTQFISELALQIDDLPTLKLCLFCYYALLQKEGRYRYLTRADFLSNEALLNALGGTTGLDDALSKATDGAFLLAETVSLDNTASQTLYFMNTPKGRMAHQQLQAGNWQPSDDNTIEILPERPTIFALYEENIGALTPMIAEHLKEAEKEYEYQWIVDAITLAIENNVRRWAYIRAILARWKEEGRADYEKAGRHSERNEYTGLNWSDFATE